MIEAMKIKVEKVAESKLASLDKSDLKFGKQFTDHMFVADYQDGEWKNAQILPYQEISMSPATSFIHYGQSIFEGLKAHRGQNGEILIFRPDMNLKRMNRSAERMCMAQLPEELFMSALKEIVDLDKGWVPEGEDASLYIRPFMFGTDAFLGVKASDSYRFMIILSPSGKYYAEPVKVKIEKEFVRASKGGTGAAKAAGNYAASLRPAQLAKADGYDQLIWTDAGEHKYIEEAGTMNIMFVIDGKLITPSLSGSILPGVTRNSIIEIVRSWDMPVEERPISVDELVEAAQSGKLTEAFGAGTAATISNIRTIAYDGIDYDLAFVEDGPVSGKLKKYLNDYKRGRVEDVFGWNVEV